jgi:hypothetical protein
MREFKMASSSFEENFKNLQVCCQKLLRANKDRSVHTYGDLMQEIYRFDSFGQSDFISVSTAKPLTSETLQAVLDVLFLFDVPSKLIKKLLTFIANLSTSLIPYCNTFNV